VHDAPTKRFDPLQRLGEVGDLEVRKREGVPGTASTSMDTDRGGSRVSLPTVSLSFPPSLERDPEKLTPEAASSLGVVGGKFD
jgi:hypothetical protein